MSKETKPAPSLGEMGTLAGVPSRIRNPELTSPEWMAIRHAWSSMPGGSSVHHMGAQAGMTVAEGFKAEAERVRAFAQDVRRWLDELAAAQKELGALQLQRAAVRAFLGTDRG